MIKVLKAGPLTTVQDLGRPGQAHLGVTQSGAADRPALIRANRLVENPDGAAGLEMTLMGARFEFQTRLQIALTGAPMPATLDGKPLPHDAPFEVNAGQVLSLGSARTGVRTYLSVSGGVDAEPVLGSRSTDLLSGLGPAVVRDGDRLAAGASHGPALPPLPAAAIEEEPLLRFLPGPREDWFAPEALDLLCAAPYLVTPQSNRIGVRLEGAALRRVVKVELESEGIVPGAIQIPAEGRPLVFLYDHPTTGGYPVVGVVLTEDLPKLAQARPGSRLRFALADPGG